MGYTPVASYLQTVLAWSFALASLIHYVNLESSKCTLKNTLTLLLEIAISTNIKELYGSYHEEKAIFKLQSAMSNL